jgi:beta-mannanase
MLTICSVDIGLRLRKSRPKLSDFKLYWLKPVAATALLAVTMGLSIITSMNFNNSKVLYAETPASQRISTPQPVNYYMTKQELIEQIQFVQNNESALPTLGIYNPTLDVPDPSQKHIQHIFIDWHEDHYLAFALGKAIQAGNTPLVTIEPRGETSGVVLLQNILSGHYDTELDELRAVLVASKVPIYIRFAHEMDLAKLYPWGAQNPELFVTAYKYVADYFRNENKENIRMVWAPAGNHGAEAYYPGDDYVDIIGTTILYDQYWYGTRYLPSFETISARRAWLKQYNKPVWVVEFGAGNANKTNQAKLIEDAIANYARLGYSALIYLNLKDANIPGPDYSLDAINGFGDLFKDPEVPKPLPKARLIDEPVVKQSTCEEERLHISSPYKPESALILSAECQ